MLLILHLDVPEKLEAFYVNKIYDLYWQIKDFVVLENLLNK